MAPRILTDPRVLGFLALLVGFSVMYEVKKRLYRPHFRAHLRGARTAKRRQAELTRFPHRRMHLIFADIFRGMLATMDIGATHRRALSDAEDIADSDAIQGDWEVITRDLDMASKRLFLSEYR
jgi:hypothetical protein